LDRLDRLFVISTNTFRFRFVVYDSTANACGIVMATFLSCGWENNNSAATKAKAFLLLSFDGFAETSLSDGIILPSEWKLKPLE
jgi:hypothetical protein